MMNKINKSDIHILLAEDETNLLDAMHFSLRRAGYTVYKAKTGNEALAIVRGRRAAGASIDLLVTDIQMPGMSGEELIKEVRAVDATVPIIVSTGFSDKELLVRLLRLGCRDFIEKPFKASHLEERIELLFNANYHDVLEKKRKEHFARIGEKARALIHDLNNVISGAVGYADMAIDEIGESHPVREKLEKILASANLVSDICRNLLALDGGRAGLAKIRTEIRSLVERMSVILRSIAPEATAIVSNAPKEPVWLDADAERIQQALLNLGINGLESMPHGGTLTFTISIVGVSRDRDTPPRACVCISVTDTGKGIPAADLSKLFAEPFTTKSGGHGYGLQTVKTIVDEHNGWIETASEQDKGTEYRLYFPA